MFFVSLAFLSKDFSPDFFYEIFTFSHPYDELCHSTFIFGVTYALKFDLFEKQYSCF